jgi:hypothetical protein
MFDFNGVGIKSAEDLQEALQIETCSKSFVAQVTGMVERWGLESTLSMLGTALCGTSDKDDLWPLKPLLKFKFRSTYDPKNPYDEGTIAPIEDEK